MYTNKRRYIPKEPVIPGNYSGSVFQKCGAGEASVDAALIGEEKGEGLPFRFQFPFGLRIGNEELTILALILLLSGSAGGEELLPFLVMLLFIK